MTFVSSFRRIFTQRSWVRRVENGLYVERKRTSTWGILTVWNTKIYATELFSTMIIAGKWWIEQTSQFLDVHSHGFGWVHTISLCRLQTSWCIGTRTLKYEAAVFPGRWEPTDSIYVIDAIHRFFRILASRDHLSWCCLYTLIFA